MVETNPSAKRNRIQRVIASFASGHLIERVSKAGAKEAQFISRSERVDQMREECLGFIRACNSMGHPLTILRDLSGDGIGLVVVERPTEHQLKLLHRLLDH